MESPAEEYRQRLDRWQATQRLENRRFIRIGNARLLVAALALALAWAAFGKHWFSGWTLIVPVAIFTGLVAWHQAVIRKRRFAARAVQYYTRAINRLQDQWSGAGRTGLNFRPKEHVYADDLDLFGEGSLFQFLSQARLHEGEQTLANWLLAPAEFVEATGRQSAVRELAPRVDLREDIALLGEEVAGDLKPGPLRKWAAEKPAHFPRFARPLALLLAVFALASLSGYFAGVLPLTLFVLALGCNFLFMFGFRKQIAHVVEPIDSPAHDLALLSSILERLEAEQFSAPQLGALRACLDVEGRPASARIRRLQRWMELLDSSDHLLLRVARPVILWREQCALAVESWRRQNGAYVQRWLTAVSDFEALSSVATLAYERPHWAVPVLVDTDASEFSATALRHPLLPEARCVPNDVSLGIERRLLIVSGSNMSGKSTYLRSIGLAAVLAWAGAPVPAATARLSRLQVGASMRVSDSLQDNRSRFFAEITRLREIVDLTARKGSLLFLLDEILSGTNSHDRRIGAAAVVKTLLANNAIGLITTHDLALADIERDVSVPAANAHFEDTVVAGQLEFDYKLRPGTVTRSNALELMRAVGLEV